MTDEIRWLSYSEAGRILGIKPESVTRRARNRRWQKRMGNDGVVLVGIPLTVLPRDAPPDIPLVVLPDKPDTSGLVLALETEVRVLREVIEDLRSDRDAWRDQAQRPRKWWPW